MSNLSPEQIEKLVHQSLRSLPARRAPRSLEHRVNAALAARAALPWWHKSFAHWPRAVQIAFVVLAGIFAAISIGCLTLGTPAVVSAFDGVVNFVEVVSAGAGSVCKSVAVIAGAIPPLWLYGAIALVVGLYASLIGAGATLYRHFQYNR